MFAFLRGSVEKKNLDKVVIDVNGVGYEVYMPQGDIQRLETKSLVKIHTFTDIKEGLVKF